ncbi:MAG: fimbrillin family protein [Prevotella sp.]|nr:fimbrillin family protein [Prevotella sp.]
MKAKYYIPLMLLTTILSLVGCSDDFDNGNGNDGNEITFTTNISNIPTGKASLYNSTSDLQTEGSFTCIAYNATTTTPYFDATKVTWVGAESKWKFANDFIHYWPGISHLDFFAYMPATKPSYISSITYGTARQPQFTCDIPADQSSIKEFVCAIATDKNKENSPSGVSMQFKHPFAILKFKLDPASGTGVTINWVRIEEDDNEGHGIKTGGTCTIDGIVANWSSRHAYEVFTWSSLTGDTYIEAPGDDSPYLVIPNDYSATKMRISVNATWTNSLSTTTLTKTATVQNVTKGGKKLMNWEPGYSYLFTLKLTDILEVSTSRYTVEQW